jgi:hypothetical protein
MSSLRPLCRRYRTITATSIDFPNIRPMAERVAAEASLADRVTFQPGNALTSAWPDRQDAVLMSYLLSAVAEQEGRSLITRALGALKPGGMLILHDFMVEDDRTGPASAALWLLAAVLNDPNAPALTPSGLSQVVRERGFTDISVRDVIPTITKVLVARKP